MQCRLFAELKFIFMKAFKLVQAAELADRSLNDGVRPGAFAAGTEANCNHYHQHPIIEAHQYWALRTYTGDIEYTYGGN